MIRCVPLCALLAVLSNQAGAQALELPSGTQAVLHEVLLDTVGSDTWVRFRLVAPMIDAAQEVAPSHDILEQDFPFLCADLALPYLRQHALQADRIAISLSDRIVEFGTTDTAATQYFEVFRREGANCIWEGF
ncbi:MAG: DUF6497 family protein [Paracoccaceae bacterium]